MPTPCLVPGAVVWIRQRRWRVRRAWRQGATTWIDVSSGDARRTFLAPFDRPAPDRPAVRLVRVRPSRARAALVALTAGSAGPRSLVTAVGASMDVLPHQLAPALAIASGIRRVLIADDVGLGKTIQAGVVLAEVQRRHPGARALVLAPAAIRHQWRDELSTRFGIDATIADRAGLDQLDRDGPFGENPWWRRGVWIASVDFLKQHHVQQAMPPVPWDLIVIDEAHDVCGESDRLALCRQLTARAACVVLLSATPHSGDAARFARLTSIGQLGETDTLTVFRRTRLDVQLPGRRRARWPTVSLSPAEQRLLGALAAFEQDLLDRTPPGRRSTTLLLLAVYRKRALSTAHALAVTLARRLAWLRDQAAPLTEAQASLPFDAIADDVNGDERAVMTCDIGVAADWEQAGLERLHQLATACATTGKVRRLGRLLARTDEPVVVFTEYRDTLSVLARELGPVRRCALMHGAQSGIERENQLRAFLDGDASALLATDVAAQGLNLQGRSRWVVSLELPWRPSRLEQRIGRVDRIGQRRDVHATVLVARHPMESALLLRLARQTSVARCVIGDAFGAIDPPIEALAEALIASPQSGLFARPADADAPSSLAFAGSRWHRLSRAAAADIRVLRTRAGAWRGPGGRHRPWISHLEARPSWWPDPRAEALSVFSWMAVNQSGAVVLQRTDAVALGRWPTTRADQQRLLSAAALVVQARARRAATRLTRRRRIAPAVSLSVFASAAAGPVPGQPGLFDRRFERHRDREAESTRARDRELEERARALTSELEVHAPVLELVLAVR